MPNWCTNRLEVYGPTEELERFSNEVEVSGELRFEALVPPPAEVYSNTEQLIKWRKDNWGTKGQALILRQDILKSPDQITYTFDTAWTPPIQWVDTVAAMYPKLRFDLSYHELGNFIAGAMCYRDGEAYSMEEYTDEGDVAEFLETVFNYDAEEFLDANRR